MGHDLCACRASSADSRGWLNLWDFEFSPDGKIPGHGDQGHGGNKGNVLIGPEKSSTRIWDITGLEQMRFPLEGYDVFSLAFSPDGKLLACGSAIRSGSVTLELGREFEPRLRVRSVDSASSSSGDRGRPVHGQQTTMGCLAFSPDGSILAGGEQYQGDFSLASVCLWTSPGAQNSTRSQAHRRYVASLSFAPDGKTIASSGAEPVVRLWYFVNTGNETFPAIGTPDGSGLASPSRRVDETTSSLEAKMGLRPAVGRRFGTRVGSHRAGFTPTSLRWPLHPTVGRTLVIGGGGEGFGAKPFYLWSVAERRETRRLARIEEREQVEYVAFAPDGKTVASERQVWDVLSRAACWRRFGNEASRMSPTRTTTLSFTRPMAGKSSRQSMTGLDFGISLGTGQFAGPSSGNEHCLATLSPDGRFSGHARSGRLFSSGPERSARHPLSSLPQASKPRRSKCK